jgi:hypothetical protein
MQESIPPVPPELLIKANQAIAEKRGKGDPTVTVIAALADDHSADELLAVTYRLHALLKLVRSGKGPAWVMSIKGKEYKLVNETMFRTAATAPLKTANPVGKIAFDPDEFLNIALAELDAGGTA